MLAIIITIMVLELKVPHGATLDQLLPLVPTILSYVLSYLYVGIYWNNHRHLLHACKKVTAGALWANLHLLFWLSLLPFATGWMGENHFQELPTAVYGGVLLATAFAYLILQKAIVAGQGSNSTLRAAFGADRKVPVGFSTSPGLSNAALYPFDVAFQARCEQLGLIYTRYADDKYRVLRNCYSQQSRRYEFFERCTFFF